MPCPCLQRGIQVINSARQGSVTGSLIGSTGSGASSSSNSPLGGSFSITAFPEGGSGPTSASKLNVGPAFLAGLYSAGVKGTFGPHWVVAVGESQTVGQSQQQETLWASASCPLWAPWV